MRARKYAVTADAAKVLPDGWVAEIIEFSAKRSGPKLKPFAERFWPKVDKRGPEECWPWLGVCTAFGHGQIKPFGVRSRDCGMLGAHIASYLLNVGAVPDGLQVLHTCDNPPCVNPGHLFLGTQLDNIADMHAKNRAGGNRDRGDIRPASKLKPEDVRLIRMLLSVDSKAAIARQFGVSDGAIFSIARGDTWAWVQ